MQRKIYVEKIPSEDPRLKRMVHHDEKSKMFAFDTSGLSIIDVTHIRHIPILDQGQVGSCTGNAGIAAIATDPFVFPLPIVNIYPPNETGALELYSAAEIIDGDGPYPPNDNGSSGLSIAKALRAKKMISAYQHTFTLDDALKAGSQYPFIVGTLWYEGMFTPDADGRVHPNVGKVAGGHEYLCRQIDATNQKIWFDNSWGALWGQNGRFYMTFADFGVLLAQKGDVTILIPPTIVPPTPAPRILKLTHPLMYGDDIAAIQIVLGIKPDGYFGSATEAAVVAFQDTHGLIADGIVGPATLAAMLKKNPQ